MKQSRNYITFNGKQQLNSAITLRFFTFHVRVVSACFFEHVQLCEKDTIIYSREKSRVLADSTDKGTIIEKIGKLITRSKNVKFEQM